MVVPTRIASIMNHLGLALLLAASGAGAQEAFPAKPIQVVLPLQAASASDIAVRIVTEKMSEIMGQGVVVENVTGVGGLIGTNRVAAARPDGYTLAALNNSILTILPHMQKGQAKAPGGQVKFQQPGGYVSCLFKNSTSQAAIKSSIATNDGQWHVIRCERTTSEVRLYIDGVFNKRIVKPTGNINNTKPWTIGGKFECDTSDPTVGADSCDYYPGDIDWIRITKGV